MKIMKKLATVLALLLLLNSCGGSATTETKEVSADTAETVVETEDRSNVDDIPADADLGGMEFLIFTRTSVPWLNSMFDVTETNGEAINDAIYARNRSVEGRLNTIISEEHYDDVDTRIDSVILAGDDTYDMCAITDRTAYAKIRDGYMYDTTALPYIDLSKKYWQQPINDALSIGGKYYLLSGNYNLTTYDYTQAMLFNKKLWTDLGLDDVYTMVREGKWTFDEFQKATAAAVLDLNGDGIMDNNDQYGFGTLATSMLPNFWVAAGEHVMVKDTDGLLKYNLSGNEHFVDIINETFAITYDNNHSGILFPGNEFQDGTMFKNNQFLLYHCNFGRFPIMRDMEVDFGIIPYPKYTLEQKQYYSSNEGGKYAFVPSTHQSPAEASMVIEAIASSSTEVFYAYYDKSLKGKSTRDEESLEMLELISDTRVLDIGRTMWQPLFVEKMARVMVENDDRNMSSLLASIETQILEEMKAVNDFVK